MWEPGDLWVHNLFIQVPMGLPTPTNPEAFTARSFCGQLLNFRVFLSLHH